MKSLSATLLAAQKSASAQPFVRAELSDYQGDRSRIRFSRVYAGAEGEYFSAAVVAGDGSLVRARIDPSTKVLYTQRVASPVPSSDFSQWVSHGGVSAQGAVALAAQGADVFLFYVDADTVTLKVKQSADNGADWGAAATVATAASPAVYLAAAIADDGDRLLLWTEGATVYRSRYSGGVWGARTAWTNAAASLTGLACSYRFDWQVVVCGTASSSGDAKVWTCVYGDGVDQAADTWSALKEVTTAAAGSNVSFRAPAVELKQHWRLFFVEKYTGSQAYSRLQYATMHADQNFGDQELWSEPQGFDHTGDYGVACARGGGQEIWLSAPAGVWLGRSPGFDDLDVSADVLEAAVELEEGGGRARLVLRNDPPAAPPAGRYAGYGTGTLGALQRGCRLQLTPGYRTPAGPETPAQRDSYWVEAVELVTGRDARLVLHARDGWWLLERWRARRQFQWAAGTKTVSQLLMFVAARAGLDYAFESTSDALTTLQPAFTIHPGESGRTAVLRLLELVPDEAFFRGATLVTRYPQPSDAADYAYGTGHAVVAARYRDLGMETNRARVLGAGVLSEGFDFTEIAATGERIGQVLDLNLTTAQEAAERAGYELRAAELRQRADELQVFGVNCGQELWDVVAVDDAQAGLSGAQRRVLGLGWRYGPRGRYEMSLNLGSV